MNVLLAFVIFTGIAWLAIAARRRPVLRGPAGFAGRRRRAPGRATRSSPSTASGTSSSPARPPSTACATGRRDGRPDASTTPTEPGATSRSTLRPAAEINAEQGALGISGATKPFEAYFSGEYTQQRPADGDPDRRRARRSAGSGSSSAAWRASSARSPTDPTAPPPVAGPGRHRDPDRRHLLEQRADPDAVRRRHPVGQPGRREHPAVPAARRRPDADDHAQALLRARISLRAEQLTYMVGFVFLFAFLIWVTGFDIIRSLGGGS